VKQISLGVFEMLNPNNGLPTWTHPDAKGNEWDSVDYWVGVAKMLDDAGFEFLFFADTYGYASIDGQVPREVVEHGIQFPGLDPMLLIAALARETRELGFVVTSPTTVEHPYASARRFATLDHLTQGRIGWNVVTGSSQATTDRLFGLTGTGATHDSRYDRADEFVQVCLKLWEGSWEDGAELRDTASGVYADSSRVRPIEHDGTHYASSGIFAVAPGRQRTPVLFQAGTSSRGREFAAQNAESVFIQGQDNARAATQVADIRAAAVANGRAAESIKVISGITIVLGETSEAAAARRTELEDLYTLEDAAVMFAGMTGIDLRRSDPDAPVTEAAASGMDAQQGQTLVDRYVRPGQPVPTIGSVLDGFRRQALRGFQLTGTPAEVADQLGVMIEETDLDGLMLEPTFGGPDCFAEFIDGVLPLLRERGLVAPAPDTGSGPRTLRERLVAGSGRLSDDHPGSRHRIVRTPTA
jgi:FMN-dependent oxidoreductase (nitrilotriacetate monooxygenase family)